MQRQKQVITAVVAFAILVGVFQVYDQTLGRLTQYEQLSQAELTQMPIEDAQVRPDGRPESHVAAVRGFGPDCQELNAPLILESRKRVGPETHPGRGVGLYVYAIDYQILKDQPNQIRLNPFSLVQISAGDGNDPSKDEILTVRGREAILQFDRNIELTKISGVKPVSGWVQGDVELKTNRRTHDPDDDVVMYTDRLHYDETRNLIWADHWIRVVERDNRVTGEGMELELYPRIAAGQPKPPRKAEARVIRLFKEVRFDLVVDDDSSMLGPSLSGAERTTKGANAPTPLTVTARGPFVLDLESNKATFQRNVQVIRKNVPREPGKKETLDQLDADELVLQFRGQTEEEKKQSAARSKDEPKGNARRTSPGMRLQTSTARGQQVVLLSDSQQLYATGNYLYHDADARRVTLIGEKEMIAVQENAKIHGRSLIIEQGDGQQIRALIADGPNGFLQLLDDDKKADPPKPMLTARWQGRLMLTTKGGNDTRLVTITKGVELDDNRGAMRCDELRVWLVPVSGEGSSKRKLEPVTVKAARNVSYHSADLSIVSETLDMDIVHRKPTANGPSPEKPIPSANEQAKKPASKEASKAGSEAPAIVSASLATREDAKAPTAKGVSGPVAPKSEKPTKQPLDVRAQRVNVIVERVGSDSKPIGAWAEGNVIVTQAPSTPQDDPLELRGATLQFERKPEGDIIRIGAGLDKEASVRSGQMILAGAKEVYLNEIRNRVEVPGSGYLVRPSENDLTGKKTAEPQLLRIDWETSMVFDGKLGIFDGAVKAQQATAEVHCEHMDVTFDRRVIFRDLRERQKQERTDLAKILTVDCDRQVIVYDRATKEGSWLSDTTIRASELHFDNLEHTVEATGPGVVQVIERNDLPSDDAGKGKPNPFPFLLTQVFFQGKMRGNDSNKTAKFYETIHIVHTPTQRLDQAVDEDSLPPDGVVIDASEHAIMGLSEGADGTKHRDFQAVGNVKVHAQVYWGQCDRLSYDQKKDRLVFETLGSQKATFYRQLRAGEKPQEFVARTIRYSRKSESISTDGIDSFNQLEFDPRTRSIRQ